MNGGESAGLGDGSPPSARIRAAAVPLADGATVIYDPEHTEAWIQSTAAVPLDDAGVDGDARTSGRHEGDGDE